MKHTAKRTFALLSLLSLLFAGTIAFAEDNDTRAATVLMGGERSALANTDDENAFATRYGAASGSFSQNERRMGNGQ